MLKHIGAFFLAISLIACSNNTPQTAQDTTSAGTIHISAEETFKPILDQQIAVFKSS